jgi:hypothetical protein
LRLWFDLRVTVGAGSTGGGERLTERQPATGRPGSHPDRTRTGRQQRASDHVMTAGRSPPDHGRTHWSTNSKAGNTVDVTDHNDISAGNDACVQIERRLRGVVF